MQWKVDDMRTSEYEPLRILGMICTYFVNISQITCSGKRTFSHDSWGEADKMVLDKVLSDERTTAYVTNIEDITSWWSDCKECNWYKSRQMVVKEA